MNDYISRQEAIDGIMHFMPDELEANASTVEGVNYSAWVCALICAKTFVRTMPSAQPERKKGKWISDGDPATWVCNNCNYRVNGYNNTNFCPNCGADMRGENDG